MLGVVDGCGLFECVRMVFLEGGEKEKEGLIRGEGERMYVLCEREGIECSTLLLVSGGEAEMVE